MSGELTAFERRVLAQVDTTPRSAYRIATEVYPDFYTGVSARSRTTKVSAVRSALGRLMDRRLVGFRRTPGDLATEGYVRPS